jgi:hypothetical protein
MRLSCLLPVTLTALFAVVAAAQAQPAGMPGRRAGLWETSMSGAGMPGPGMKMRQCVTPASERGFSPFAAGPGRGEPDAAHCSKRETHRTANGWAFESVCTQGGRTVTTTGTLTGDFQTHYRLDLTSNGDGAPRRMTMDNSYIGPCPAAGAGNTIVLPDGRTVTIPRH